MFDPNVIAIVIRRNRWPWRRVGRTKTDFLLFSEQQRARVPLTLRLSLCIHPCIIKVINKAPIVW